MDDRISIFYPAHTDTGYIQAVICASDLPHFVNLGFCSSVDNLEYPENWGEEENNNDQLNDGQSGAPLLQASRGPGRPRKTDNSEE